MGEAKRRKLLDPNYGKVSKHPVELIFGNIFRLDDCPHIKKLLSIEARKTFSFGVCFVNESTASSGISLFSKNFDMCMIVGMAKQSSSAGSFEYMFGFGYEQIKCQSVAHIKKLLRTHPLIEVIQNAN